MNDKKKIKNLINITSVLLKINNTYNKNIRIIATKKNLK